MSPVRSVHDALATCAAEPIRIPGAIQPHGWLLALREPELSVVSASANVAELLGVPIESVVGSGLSTALGGAVADALRPAIAADPGQLDAHNPVAVHIGGSAYDAVLHRAGGLLLVELEATGDGPEGSGPLGWYQQLRRALHRLPRAGSVGALADTLTEVVSELTSFDRVMAYRFTPEWDGEVIAERRGADLEPFLGLRFPAADIPAQARELYTSHWLRLIATSEYTPVPLVPDRDPSDGAPLDLSGSTLRSVSPVHLQYLRNMGVTASMSVSLVTNDRLWGLIACHHHSGAHHPPYRVRAAAEVLGRMASILLGQQEITDRAERRADQAALRARVTAGIGAASRDDPSGAVVGGDLLALVDATGVTVRLGAGPLCEGAPLPPPVADAVAAALLENGDGRGVGATDQLADLDPEWAALAPGVAGALAVRVADSVDRYVLWTRPEWQGEITWAGDPRHLEADVAADGQVRISPRTSFAAWVQHIGQRSRTWEPADLDQAADLGRELSDVVLRRVFERNEVTATLQRTLLLEGLPDVAGIDAAVRYLPGGLQPVGGDWFDLLSLPDGRCTLAIGDVAGHGLMVAAVTAQLRQGLRAYLLRETGPHCALDRLNELASWVLPEDLATALVVELVPATGALRWVTAGHLPPLVAAGPDTRYLSGRPGPALGVKRSVTFPANGHTLRPGEVLVLYSDGLIERRGESIDAGLERLRLAAARLPSEPDALCQGLVERLGAGGRPDDVTVVAARRQAS